MAPTDRPEFHTPSRSGCNGWLTKSFGSLPDEADLDLAVDAGDSKVALVEEPILPATVVEGNPIGVTNGIIAKLSNEFLKSCGKNHYLPLES